MAVAGTLEGKRLRRANEKLLACARFSMWIVKKDGAALDNHQIFFDVLNKPLTSLCLSLQTPTNKIDPPVGGA